MKIKIKQLFADNSMPKMVLLNGAWGSGKTYWIENNLIEPEGYIYLSLNGLASIDDFYSNLISKFFLNKNISATDSSSLLDGFQKILGNFNGENKGLISGLVSGFKGVAVTKAISSIEDKTIVLDDLERIVNANLAKEIVGICQNLSEKNHNLKFIFATNTSELKFDNKHSLLEKNFAGIVEFKLNKNEFLEIIKENVQQELKVHAARVVEELELKNIRIIKRAKNKYCSLIEEIESDDSSSNLDILKGRKALFGDVMKIYFMQMELGCNVEIIKSQSKENINFKIPGFDTDKKDKANVSNIEEYLNLPQIESQLLVEHIAFCKTFSIEEVLKKYYPVKVLTIDLLLKRGVTILTEADEEKIPDYVNQLVNIIKEEEPDLLRWFNSVDVINELFKYKFIESVKGISIDSKPAIKSILDQYLPKKFKTPVPVSGRLGYQPEQFGSKELNKKFESILENIKNENKLKTITVLESEIHKGWTKEVDLKIYKEYRTVDIFSSFKNYPEFVNAMKHNWTAEQIYLFSDFINVRYEANLTDRLVNEYDFLKALEMSLSKFTNGRSGIKIGMFNKLIKALKEVLSKIDNDKKKGG